MYWLCGFLCVSSFLSSYLPANLLSSVFIYYSVLCWYSPWILLKSLAWPVNLFSLQPILPGISSNAGRFTNASYSLFSLGSPQKPNVAGPPKLLM